jgi:hypothetical protein
LAFEVPVPVQQITLKIKIDLIIKIKL